MAPLGMMMRVSAFFLFAGLALGVGCDAGGKTEESDAGTGSDGSDPTESSSGSEESGQNESGSESGDVGSEGAESSDVADDSSDSEGESDSGPDDGYMGEDLFACQFQSPCVNVSAHLDTEPLEGMVCAAELIAEGTVAVLFGSDIPGPDSHTWQHVAVLMGDGTALKQTRYRAMASDPWELREQKQCTVVTSEAMLAACAEDPVGDACRWDLLFGGLTGCEPVATDSTCEDIEALLP